VMLRMRDIFLFPFGFRGGVDYIHPQAWPEARRWAVGSWRSMPRWSWARSCSGPMSCCGVWFFPLLVGLPFLRLYLMCEHTLCPNSDDGFANTRTTISNPIVRFLMWNLPLSRRAPSVPQHRLPQPARSATATCGRI